MKATLTAFTTLAIGGAFLVGCKGPSSGPETPAGSPGTGTNVPMNNTPGLAGTGDMAPANRGTDTRTRVGDDTDAGVTDNGRGAQPGSTVQPGSTAQPGTTVPPGTNAQPGTSAQPRSGGEPTTRPPTPAPLPRGNPPTTAPTTNPSTR